jgi:hypothetical protein
LAQQGIIDAFPAMCARAMKIRELSCETKLAEPSSALGQFEYLTEPGKVIDCYAWCRAKHVSGAVDTGGLKVSAHHIK